MRLGEVNAQTRWLLDKSEAPEPDPLAHVYLRVRDVMREEFPTVEAEEPVRDAGLTMAREDLDLVPVVDDDGELAGVVTERALARRYIRESREVSSLVDAPTAVGAVRDVLAGRPVDRRRRREGGGPGLGAVDGCVQPHADRRGRRGGGGRQRGRPAAGHRARRGAAGDQQRDEAVGRDPRPGRRARDGGDLLPAGHLRVEPDDHPRRPLPRADGQRPADGGHRRPAVRCLRPGQGGALPGRGGHRQKRPPDRAGHPVGPRRAQAAPGAAGRPCRAGAERARGGGGGDRGDPRPPPHRLGGDQGAGHARPSTRSAPPPPS